jgi:Zn-dependent protease
MKVFIFINIVILLFSAVIHEISHAFIAYLRGDDTAKMLGRITLNPIPHIDLFGSIILPFTLFILNSHILFAWAKPVPVNYNKLKNPRVDMALISCAGPAANLLLAVMSGLGICFIRMFPVFESGIVYAIGYFFCTMVIVNVSLLIINLIPIPPLDGSKIIAYFLPDKIAEKYLNLNPYVGLLILVVVLSSGIFTGIIYPIGKFCVIFFARGY